MRSKDWRTLGIFLVILGFSLFFRNALEYSNMPSPLYWGGALLLVMGLFCNWKARNEARKLRIPSPSLPSTPPQTTEAQIICKYCGYVLTHDVKHCPKCGKARD